ncbi:glycosyltransferase family 2 protein [Paenibacillus paeoniae]|uniref:Glycosyltransferase family 2 protein n=1 Tax=Paenibacillus paeoniae TaxID=2292705 RepID=A0A371P8F4_9BACL|nr:glycosyltransferase family 2 protein [Paenibacillus paeoniae]REK71818.1 glycosyltransferase family 2 protein [Paenibacillus paeoniae]
MNHEPLISIIIPTYNRAAILPTSIQSVIDQTYQNWELLVVSDRCSDHTQEVVESYCSSDSRIRFLVNDRTKGVGGARNCGLMNAQGACIAFLDSDDQWYPHHLKDSIHMMNESRADICFALWVERHESKNYKSFDNELEQSLLREMKEQYETLGDGIIIEKGLLERFIINPRHFYCISTMVFKKELLHNFGLFNEQFSIGEDTSFMIQFFDHCRIALITKYHLTYNQSPDSVYLFCDRRLLDPDTLHLQKELFDKIEFVGLQTIKMRLDMQALVKRSPQLDNQKKLHLYTNYNLARQYYTLSYINKPNKRKALRYCFLSMRHNVNLFNILLMFHILFIRGKGNNFLKRPLNLW